jgi:hypothetical protein
MEKQSTPRTVAVAASCLPAVTKGIYWRKQWPSEERRALSGEHPGRLSILERDENETFVSQY